MAAKPARQWTHDRYSRASRIFHVATMRGGLNELTAHSAEFASKYMSVYERSKPENNSPSDE